VWHPQGKNISSDEFSALGDMLATMTWELPGVQEYKGDLMQPTFLHQQLQQGHPSTLNNAIVPSATPNKPDPAGPCHPEQWAKVQKMVA